MDQVERTALQREILEKLNAASDPQVLGCYISAATLGNIICEAMFGHEMMHATRQRVVHQGRYGKYCRSIASGEFTCSEQERAIVNKVAARMLAAGVIQRSKAGGHFKPVMTAEEYENNN